ncbi:alpha/beta hydrolase [Ferrimonas gelatinilytica]|uniref:Alpha/beta hydrolase n=1 Tax=Ferrimonas gelatinilytica TaxID=1255257 RepID=A0ABP9RX78_9GAMM
MQNTYIPELMHWYQSGQLRTIQGHQLFYGLQGEGPVLVLLHGFPSSSWDWQYLLPMLTPHYRVLYLDMLGFGFSDKPRIGYGIHEQADRVLALMQHLSLKHAHLLAHDYGDTVAQELLARQRRGNSPVYWHSCALLNGGLFPEAHHPLKVQKLLAGPLGPLIVPLLSRKRFERSMMQIWGNTPPSQNTLLGMWQLLNYHNGTRVMPKLLSYMEQRRLSRARWVNALSTCPVPLMLIDGTKDPISGESLVTRFRQLCPNAELVTLEGVGHYPQLEAPEQVFEAYQEFRARLEQNETVSHWA